jgi:hypothetical protein
MKNINTKKQTKNYNKKENIYNKFFRKRYTGPFKPNVPGTKSKSTWRKNGAE